MWHGPSGLGCLRGLRSGSRLVPHRASLRRGRRRQEGTKLANFPAGAVLRYYRPAAECAATENHQGEVALEKKTNSEGCLPHVRSSECSQGAVMASKRRQDNLLGEEENNAMEIQ